MKVNFVKRQIEVGLSCEVPLTYRGPEQKYVLADSISDLSLFIKDITLTETRAEFDSEVLPFLRDLGPARLKCIEFVGRLPESALPEALETLRELDDHYRSIEDMRRSKPLPQEPPTVTPVIVEP